MTTLNRRYNGNLFNQSITQGITVVRSIRWNDCIMKKNSLVLVYWITQFNDYKRTCNGVVTLTYMIGAFTPNYFLKPLSVICCISWFNLKRNHSIFGCLSPIEYKNKVLIKLVDILLLSKLFISLIQKFLAILWILSKKT